MENLIIDTDFGFDCDDVSAIDFKRFYLKLFSA